MTWAALQAGAPDLAREGRLRFERSHVALLGTIRGNGLPRISPVEPYFLAGELVFGVMRSPKLDDLRQRPGCVLHSAISDVNGTEGEFKVYGRAIVASAPSILGASTAWWASRDATSFAVFTLEIDEAVLVAWDRGADRMRTTRWSKVGGERSATRPYP